MEDEEREWHQIEREEDLAEL
jgi:hypothetical protein